jgi:uncharacterized coiled-coil DUF342 family protein
VTHITDMPERLRAIAGELDRINREISQYRPERFDRNGAIQEAYDRTGAMVNDVKRAARAIDRAIREAGGE